MMEGKGSAEEEKEDEDEEPAPLASLESAGTGYPSLVPDQPAAATADDDWETREEF